MAFTCIAKARRIPDALNVCPPDANALQTNAKRLVLCTGAVPGADQRMSRVSPTNTWRTHTKCDKALSTYNSLTTCATYGARNRSRPDVACRPHSNTLRNRASDVRRCHSFPTFSEKNVADVASQKTYGQKARTAGCDRRLRTTQAGGQ
ncbi:hypothetical protein Bbelb_334460 [Branchiostoma belcheri]|nr:hypothetical protein Bbelb_334460 [Branchiostoma belcheri]